MASIKLYSFVLVTFIIITAFSSSCSSYREQGKIFHAAPMSGGIAALSFGLYNDDTYQICNSGGIGQFCYTAKFKTSLDTITLLDLNGEVPLKSNRLLISRYSEQDSSYWEWKFSRLYKSFSSDRTLGKWVWQNFKDDDMASGDGDVYQIDSTGARLKDEYHFIIRLDSLKNYHKISAMVLEHDALSLPAK